MQRLGLRGRAFRLYLFFGLCPHAEDTASIPKPLSPEGEKEQAQKKEKVATGTKKGGGKRKKEKAATAGTKKGGGKRKKEKAATAGAKKGGGKHKEKAATGTKKGGGKHRQVALRYAESHLSD